MVVDRSDDPVVATLDRPQERQQCTGVVALGEALAIHQPTRFEHMVRMQETIGRDEIDLGVVGPTGKERRKRRNLGPWLTSASKN